MESENSAAIPMIDKVFFGLNSCPPCLLSKKFILLRKICVLILGDRHLVVFHAVTGNVPAFPVIFSHVLHDLI